MLGGRRTFINKALLDGFQMNDEKGKRTSREEVLRLFFRDRGGRGSREGFQ